MSPTPRIVSIDPLAALPGGEVRLHGSNLVPSAGPPDARVGGLPTALVSALGAQLVVRVPDSAVSGIVDVRHPSGDAATAPQPLEVGVQIADNVHPVCNPVVDLEGNIIVTLSGSRGQKTPVSLFKIDANYGMKALSSAITNPSGLAFNAAGELFVSSRHDGAVYRVALNGSAAAYAEGLGIATGIAFDPAGDLYVGDRSGTIFKIDQQRKTFVFATLEPSVAAYHLAFDARGDLFVTGPSTSSNDFIWRINPSGHVEIFASGLGRPQGMAFQADGTLLVVASYQGRRGVVAFPPTAAAPSAGPACVISANNLVGLAFAPNRGTEYAASLILATNSALFHLPWKASGAPLPPRLS